MGVPRFDRDGRPISPAGPFGGGRREPVESPAQKRERFSGAPEVGTPHEAMEEFGLAWEEVAGELGAVEHEAQPIDAAIGAAVQASAAKVETALMTREQRLAKAIASELKGRCSKLPTLTSTCRWTTTTSRRQRRKQNGWKPSWRCRATMRKSVPTGPGTRFTETQRVWNTSSPTTPHRRCSPSCLFFFLP